MARALDEHALETSNRRLSFKEETRKMIELIRSSTPSRNPMGTSNGNNGNVRVWYPSKKMNCIIQAESYKVEFPSILELEHRTEYEEDFLGEIQLLERCSKKEIYNEKGFRRHCL